MAEPVDTNAGADARSGFDMEEGHAKGGDIEKVADPSENIKEGEPDPASQPGKGEPLPQQGETQQTDQQQPSTKSPKNK